MNALVRTALLKSASAFAECGIEWQLGGSGLLYSHGLVDNVRDLDLVFPPATGDRLIECLEELTGEAATLDARQEPGFLSGWRGKHMVDGVELDMTSRVTLEGPNGLVHMPFETGGTWALEGRDIPLAPLTHWIVIYRHHNPSRAALIEPLVEREEWLAFATRIGVPADLPPA